MSKAPTGWHTLPDGSQWYWDGYRWTHRAVNGQAIPLAPASPPKRQVAVEDRAIEAVQQGLTRANARPAPDPADLVAGVFKKPLHRDWLAWLTVFMIVTAPSRIHTPWGLFDVAMELLVTATFLAFPAGLRRFYWWTKRPAGYEHRPDRSFSSRPRFWAPILVPVLAVLMVTSPAASSDSADAAKPAPSASPSPTVMASASPTKSFERMKLPMPDPNASVEMAKWSKWLDDYAKNFTIPSEYSTSGIPLRGKDLAAAYPVEGSSVVTSLRASDDIFRAVNTSLSSRNYDTAQSQFDSASAALTAVPDQVVADLAAAEQKFGTRLGGDAATAAATETGDATVVRWIDGDSLLTTVGEVRLIGIDTPELSAACQAAEDALEFMTSFAPPGSRVELGNPVSVKDTDKYDRQLRYLSMDGADAGYAVLRAGLARARYDSRDGYQWHPAEKLYRETGPIEAVDMSICDMDGDDAAFILIADDDSDRNKHRVALLAAAYAASKTVSNFAALMESTKAYHVELDRPKYVPPPTYEPPAYNPPSSGGGGGYTGCRRYAPGGKSWVPIPCP